VEERAIVEALCHRDPAGLAAAYDQYAARLYDYCAALLQDQDAAGDAVHDALLVAADRAHQLRDPSRLRAWLYAIARNECLRQLKRRKRLAPLDKAGEVTDESVDVDRRVAAEQAQALVRDAAAGLNAREREVLDLTLRHELSGAELAAALGVPANHAHALLSKAREQLERSVGALLTARAGRQDCAELAGVLAGWDGEFTPLVRKRVSRHIEKCAVCGVRRAHEVRAEALFAALPFLVIPALLRRRVLESHTDLDRVAHTGRAAEPFDRAGFPVPIDRQRFRGHAAAWLSAAAVLALLLGGGAVAALQPGDTATVAEPRKRGGVPTETPSDPGALAEPTPAFSPSASPTPPVVTTTPPPRTVPDPPRPTTARPTPTRASPSPSPSTPVPTVVVDVARPDIECSNGPWTGGAVALVNPTPVDTVELHWWVDPAKVTSVRMSRRGDRYVASVPLPTDQEIFYLATAVLNGKTGQSDQGVTFMPGCIG
jgi:RNA polymerase sigma factor (sigma-70 family)